MQHKNKNRAGSEEQYGPSTIEEIVRDFLAHSHSPFAEAYRRRQHAQQAKQRTTAGQGMLFPNTHLCVDMKTLL
ncbi:MAG: hypothetical protein K5660_09485, partial [Paludibacteraceae bacterium]|nr:hypothetical protein [Paludibacteraceae bacterium]